MIDVLRRSLVHVLILSLLSLGSPVTAQAAMIGTLAGLESAEQGRATDARAAALSKIDRVLAGEQVRERMKVLGVDEGRIAERLAGLTDAELQSLATKIDNAPAGAGVLEVVGIVFIVLLILEAVGVIDIFSKFP